MGITEELNQIASKEFGESAVIEELGRQKSGDLFCILSISKSRKYFLSFIPEPMNTEIENVLKERDVLVGKEIGWKKPKLKSTENRIS